MKKNQNLITWKIEYSCDSDLFEYIDSYNKVFRFTYNRLLENPKMSTKELTSVQKTMKNLPDNVGSHVLNSVIYDARALVQKSEKPIIFGGKLNFIKRCQHKINKDEFLRNRLLPFYSVGEAVQKGNRLFRILSGTQILFQSDRNHHYLLNLKHVGRNRLKYIKDLMLLQNTKGVAITYKMDFNFIYITFDYNLIRQNFYNIKQNRVIAIDMNPNNLGYSVIDWKDSSNYQLIESGTFSIKPLNDYQNSLRVSSNSVESRYIHNKRRHEIIELAKRLFDICKHYKCEIFAIEDLNFKNKNNTKSSRKFNKLVNNQWLRTLLVSQIRKLINSSSTTLVEVQPQYSSFIGNLVYRKEHLPDECLASIEIGRRGFEFSTQYIFNRRPHEKTVIFPKMETVKNQLSISLAEIGIDVPELVDWKNIYSMVKKSEKKYRFSISDAISSHSDSLFSKFYKQRYLNQYIFV